MQANRAIEDIANEFLNITDDNLVTTAELNKLTRGNSFYSLLLKGC